MDQWVSDHTGVGQLVSVDLCHLASPQNTPPEMGTRIVITEVGENTIQGVYPPPLCGQDHKC